MSHRQDRAGQESRRRCWGRVEKARILTGFARHGILKGLRVREAGGNNPVI